MNDLPPLPKSFREWWNHGGDNDESLIEVFHEYALAERKATIERCADLCSKISFDWQGEGKSEDCEAAIRALLEE